MSLLLSGALLPAVPTTPPPMPRPPTQKKAPIQEQPQPSTGYMSGHCSAGHHEGLKLPAGVMQCIGDFNIRDWTDQQGRLITPKTYACTCDCHEPFRQMQAITGVRQSHVEREVSHERRRAQVGLRAQLSRSIRTPTDADPTGEHGSTGVLGPENSPFRPTKSGRRARGELEAMVASVLMTWFQSKPEPAMVPLEIKFIQMALKKNAPDKTFSSGAILRCLQRWSDKSWVVLQDKPHRIIQPTERGIAGLKKWAQ